MFNQALLTYARPHMTCTMDKLEGFKIPYILMKRSITVRRGSFELRVPSRQFREISDSLVLIQSDPA